MTTLDELEAIRARHWVAGQYVTLALDAGQQAHADRATLLRLLDAAREELDAEQVSHLKTRAEMTELRRAAGVITGRKWVELLGADFEAAVGDLSTLYETDVPGAINALPELLAICNAAKTALGLLDDPSCPVTGLDETRRARAILAAALKAPPTRAQGESS